MEEKGDEQSCKQVHKGSVKKGCRGDENQPKWVMMCILFKRYFRSPRTHLKAGSD